MKCEIINAGKHIVNVESDTQYVLNTLDGAEFDVTLVFGVHGVKAELICAYALKDRKVEIKTTSKHIAENTSCEIKVKGVLYDNSGSSYVGSIIIEKSANQTSSFLHDDMLVIGNNTSNSSQPILEISADEVKASHGATTGRISNDQTYYLMSRGLSMQESQQLISEGFLQVLISQILDATIRSQIEKVLI